MDAFKLLLLPVLGVLLTSIAGLAQGSSIGKRSSERAIDLDLESQLSRVKRLDAEAPELSRTKRRDVVENDGLSRMKRYNTDEMPSLSREKRGDMENPALSRMKRGDLDDNSVLSREKRQDLSENIGLSRMKRGDELDAELSREKRHDVDDILALSRTKRDGKNLLRVKRVDPDSMELERVKRGEVILIRKRRNTDDAEKDISGDITPKEKTQKRKTENQNLDKADQKALVKKSSHMKRKRGYWEKRKRGDYLVREVNRREMYHKRRNMNKRGRSKLMKKKAIQGKQKLQKEAKIKRNWKKAAKKSLGNSSIKHL